ncbi:hypothetical protein RM533_02175 [Croceicoccus sp. F390]|uniref:D-alanine--D-alanine ligase n=1 Tax=Croceicoccus esteveae TaxID=3075597 RepID=A0ABU2ZEG2_9SPHN|nr:hypothetical protein [Croceicoccus sp. F390]MDT0574987.1 hypothetical protein [Croceicoccus sp. F390]
MQVAVLFGGASQEHDVSVVSAQQLMDAADVRKISITPVYTDFENRFFSSPTLRDIRQFKPKPANAGEVFFRWSANGPVMQEMTSGRQKPIDCILPVFHGPFGEDGRLQGHFELLGIPVTGFAAGSSAMAMRKDATKALVKLAGVNVLDHVTANRASLADSATLVREVTDRIGFPAIVKPANLGSSIGVGLAKTPDELAALVAYVLAQDNLALIEPQVQHLVEYNIAMRWSAGEVHLSAIERPKSSAELLDFREKYLSSGGAVKGAFLPSEGMLSLTRDINPQLPDDLQSRIHDYARKAFVTLGHRGTPRIDFMANARTGELWFNEINAIPGSYGFFLWEAAPQPLLFPELINHLVTEALGDTVKRFDDPVPQGAYLLPR